MCETARLFNCTRCGDQVVICSCCDRGNRYCQGCAPAARQASRRSAGERYHELMVIGITRESVDTGDVRPLLNKLEALASSREEAIAWEGKLTFYFDGWDADPRETSEIPEIRSYFLDVTAEFPYWFHYIEKVGDTFGHVLRLPCRGHIERQAGGVVGWMFDDLDDLDDLKRHIGLLFGGMNALYGRLALPPRRCTSASRRRLRS